MADSVGTDPLDKHSAIVVVSGTQGAGKTTVSGILARRFARGVHVSGDAMQLMIVSGREWPDADSVTADAREVTGAAGAQLRLRLHNACLLARSFFEAGFTVVIDDIVVGTRLDELLHELDGVPFAFVMLVPDRAAVREREAARGTSLYEDWEWLDDEIRTKTRRIGHWIDSSKLTPDETVDEILRRVREQGVISATNEHTEVAV